MIICVAAWVGAVRNVFDMSVYGHIPVILSLRALSVTPAISLLNSDSSLMTVAAAIGDDSTATAPAVRRTLLATDPLLERLARGPDLLKRDAFDLKL